ncbi:MAG TPA: N-acetylglucosamine-6-phosphate deacetylase [Anaerolineaceae bacterium]
MSPIVGIGGIRSKPGVYKMDYKNQTILAGEAWTPTRKLCDCQIEIAGGRITRLTPGVHRLTAGAIDARDGIVISGLIDLQVNGALGWSFQAEHAAHWDEILVYHHARGTTTLLPTLVTAPPDVLEESLLALSAYLDAHPGAAAGIHLEGPFLSPEKRGAHDETALQAPSLPLLQRFERATGKHLRLVTLAPELPGALELIAYLAKRGILVSAGHSTAGYTEMQAAVQAGLRLVTHAGNASDWPLRRLGKENFLRSEPALVGSLLALDELSGGVILDGFHFHPALLKPLLKVKGPGKIFLVSDAAPMAGCPPGEYLSGGLAAVVHAEGYITSGRGEGVGWLAGSAITLLDALQRAVSLAGLPFGAALRMATLTPATILGIQRRKGCLRVGADGDLVILNRDLSLRAVTQVEVG